MTRGIKSRALPDILVLAETKIDESFPTSQSLVNEYNTPTRCDRTKFGGVSSNILEKVLSKKS